MLDRLYIGATLSIAAIVASAVAVGSPTFAQSEKDTPSLQHSVVLSGLNSPWDMAFLPDGTMFYTEKCLGLSVRTPSGEVNALLGMGANDTDVSHYATVADDLFCDGQAGMNGVAVDPNFNENRRIYVFSASRMSDPATNRVMRFTVNEDFTNVADRTDIVDDIPYKTKPTDHPFGATGTHNGGRIRFSPADGFLYVTTGDNHSAEIPQSPTSLGSKVLRIDTEGKAAPENSPPEGFDPRTYTYGHRNVQGITFHPETNKAIIAEHGPWHSDEITVLENGGNGGWDPRDNMAGRGECPDGYCGYMPNQMEGLNRYKRAAFMPMTDFDTYPNAMPPIWANNGWSQGMATIDFLTGKQWGNWEGNMVVGIMGIAFGDTPVGQRIDLIKIDDGNSLVDVTEMPLPMEPGRFRSLVLGPDGSLYAAVEEGTIYKLTPKT